MGQANSSDKRLTDDVEIFGEEVFRQARLLSEIATLSYEDFLEYLEKLNGLSQHCMDAEGKQLIFLVKTGTDSSLFWRSRVRIACVKVNPVTKEIDSYRLMNLNEFLKVFRSLNSQYQTAQQISNCQEAVEDMEPVPESTSSETSVDANQEPSTSSANDSGASTRLPLNKMTASVLLREVDKAVASGTSSSSSTSSCKKIKEETLDQFVECCICLDRTPNVMLPCAHSYCKPCIEKWNVNHKTCPVCREEVKSSDDAWVVISEAPNSLEVNEELCSTLMNILNEHSGSSNSMSDNVTHRRLVRNVTNTTSTSTATDIDEDEDDDDDIYEDYDNEILDESH